MNELVKARAASVAVMPTAVLEQDPDTNTEAMVSSLASHSCKVTLKHRMLFPTDPKTGEMTGWREVVDRAEVATAKTTDIVSCQRVVADALAPASDRDIALWLAELSTISVRRSESAEEGALAITAYTRRLRAYPGDIVRDTLQSWTGKWFPTWGELKEILDTRSGPRREIQNAITAEAASALKDTGDKRLPRAVQNMQPEDKLEWLRWEARRAARTDPDWSKELNEQIEDLEAELRRPKAQEA